MTRLLFALLLAGCTSTSLKTATVLEVESKYHVMPMVQTPTVASAQELISVINRLWPLVLQELVTEGRVADPESVESTLKGTRVALIEEPEACGVDKPCVGHAVCARVRGCAWGWARAAWIARRWPPMRRAEWPMEPCDHAGTVCAVTDPAAQSTDYIQDLAHELAEMALWAEHRGETAHSPEACAAVARAVARYRSSR